MKRILSVVLALSMLFSLISVLAEDPHTAQHEGAVHGFRLIESTTFPLVNAEVYYYVHEKTGAELLYIKNEDTNRVFDISFKTPAESDMGVPHVFEHATLGGSEKYPSRDLFFNLSYQTYNTYMNAATYSNMTTYPVSSLSEDQLLMYADFYTDSCLHPMVKNDKSIFEEEAWRYSMDSAEGELTLSGTVYTEMQGAYDISRAASYNLNRVLFPGANTSFVSGGTPEAIPAMTWEDVTAFHENYYHPSNSISFLYGKFAEPERFFALLDGYFSEYEKAEIVIEDKAYTPITEKAEIVFTFPAEASAETDKAGYVYYAMRIDGADTKTVHALDILTTLLSSPSFPLIQNLKSALPSANAGAYISLDTPEPAVIFYASGVNEEDAPIFRDTVNASLKEIAENGLDRDAVDAVVASLRMETMLITESSSLGVSMIPNFAYYWACTGDWHGYMQIIDALSSVNEMYESGLLIDIIEEHLLDNEISALVTTVPQPGLKEENDAKLKAALAEIKAGMTEEEIAGIVSKTAALSNPSGNDAMEFIPALQAVTVDSLPEEIRIYDYTDETGEDGVRRIDVNANVSGVGQAMLLLDVGDLPQEYLHWYQLYLDLLGEVDTTEHTKAQLSALITRYLYSGVIKASMPFEDDDHLFLRAAWIALDEDMQAAYDLLYELLFESSFTNAGHVSEFVSSRITSLKNSIMSNIYSTQLYRAQSVMDEDIRTYVYMTDIDYYLFLVEVQKLLEAQPEAVLETLSAVQTFVNNGAGAISAFAGSEESAENHRLIADSFIASLNSREVVPAEYAIPAPARAEGIIVESSVQYNLLFATWEELGMAGYSGAMDAITSVVADTFLYPLLREQYGAYSVIHQATDAGILIISYRDPNVTETFDVYASLADLIRDYAIDQATLDGYILSAYSRYALSVGELGGAANAILNIIAGEPQDKALGWMKDLKAIKAETFSSYADMYEKLSEVGVISTAGGAASVVANSALYEAVLNPFGAVDPSSVEFTDLPADHPLYASVRFAFENGVMSAVSDTEFGTDAPAGIGDFAAACYVLLGGGLVPEEAVGYLAQFGILPNADPAAEVTRAEVSLYLANFFTALGMPVEGAELPAFEDASEAGEYAPYIGWAIANGFVTPECETVLAPNAILTRGEMAAVIAAFVSALL